MLQGAERTDALQRAQGLPKLRVSSR